jgi:Uma2 family endonuclease
MSQPAVSALAPLPFELVTDDGVPVERNFHVDQMSLLTHLIRRAMKEQGRTDFFTGANLFVYYSVEQARQVALEVEQNLEQRAFRGPDVFWVGGVEPKRDREIWVAWEEGGRLPDVIVELLSPSTATKDRTDKKDLYARVFGTAEYYLYDQDSQKLEGHRLSPRRIYRPMAADARGRLWSEQLGVFLGLWHGVWEEREDTWVRLFHADGSLVLTKAESESLKAENERQRADAERQRAETERQRADAAEAELARLRALLQGRSGS